MTKRKWEAWKEWQIDHLTDNYNCKSNMELAEHIGKSEASIAQKLGQLNLKRTVGLQKDSKRTAKKLLFAEWDRLFGPPPKSGEEPN